MKIADNFAGWVLLITILATIFISFRHKEKKDLLPIRMYAVVAFLLRLTYKMPYTFPKTSIFSNESAVPFNIQCLIEILIFYHFIFDRIVGRTRRIAMAVMLVVYILFCVKVWEKAEISDFIPALNGLQSLLIVIACFFYIYEELKSDFYIDLKNNPDLIIICGILVNFSFSVPVYFSWYNLWALSSQMEYHLNFSIDAFYILLFLSIMKAYLCHIPSQRQ